MHHNNEIKYIKLKILLALILISFIIFYFLKDYDSKGNDIFVILTFIIIIFISFKEIFNVKNLPYGLSQIFYLFTLTFLGLAPFYQYLKDITLWGGEEFTNHNFICVNILLIVSLLLYKHFYLKILKKDTKTTKENSIRVSPILLLCISLIASMYIYLIYGSNISALIFRNEYSSSDIVSGGGISYLLNSFFIRPIPAICFLLYKFYKYKSFFLEILLLTLMLLTNAPTGMPRFAVAAFYIPLIFIYMPSIKKKMNFPFIIIFALLIIFPILNLFRLSGDSRNLKIDLSMLLQGHFDSYQMMARVISENFITYGNQLLGVIFFYIPRSIWPTKPIGSGYLIAHEYNYYFDNLSMNYFGEGYINFGIIGMLAFSIILGYINGYFDRLYWVNKKCEVPKFSLIYCISIGMEFAILRGALLNIFPVLIGYISSLVLVHNMVKIRKK